MPRKIALVVASMWEPWVEVGGGKRGYNLGGGKKNADGGELVCEGSRGENYMGG